MCSSRLETVVSGNLLSCLKEVKPIFVYEVQRDMALDTMQGNQASSQVDVGYTELFRTPLVTPVCF